MTGEFNPWLNLPEPMRNRAQWCIAGSDKAPLILGNNGLQHASPITGPWLDFDNACKLAKEHKTNIGFIITKEDPFTCIDLDVKDAQSRKNNGQPYSKESWTSAKALEGYEKVLAKFQSYAELSVQKKGVHIWVEGNIGAGIKREGVEIYSQERFIVCTGNSIREIKYNIDKDVVHVEVIDNNSCAIRECSDLLHIAVANMTAKKSNIIELEEVEQELEDYEILNLAMKANNADKFNKLCQGKWEELNYPSQSEADLSLMSMFTFYSKSNEQCRRLFRLSELGKREKAIKNNRYLDFTLKAIRSRQSEEKTVKTSLTAQAKQLVKELQEKKYATDSPKIENPTENYDNLKTHEEFEPYSIDDDFLWPPGFTGYLAETIFKSSPRPVKEVSIVAALGFLAGLLGKAYNISDSGLNAYIILVARSAIGKEAMHSGIALLVERLVKSHSDIHNYVNFTDFASGPALVKACAEFPCFVNVAGEWGRKLKRMATEDRVDGPMQQLRTVMTNLYQKSSSNSIVGGLTYSKKEDNIASISGVAYSLIGETTPGTFYESLTNSMMEDGFLSRFIVINYPGNRPTANKNRITNIPTDMTDWLSNMLEQVKSLTTRFAPCEIEVDSESEKLFSDFDDYCDKEINKTLDEGWRQMWNRAHLKALRIAGLLAAADNFIKPIVKINHAQWALDLILRDINMMSTKIREGDIGQDDNARERKLLAIMKDYLESELKESYGIPSNLHADGIVPRRYLQTRISRINCFYKYKRGTTQGLDLAIESLRDNGHIVELEKYDIIDKYGNQGRCFRILNVDDTAY